MPADSPTSPGLIARALDALVSQIPTSSEATSALPHAHAQTLARSAAIKAAALSGGLSLPGGPLGLATVLPDLISLWRIQQQLVADIAATFGRSDALTRETMLVSLFKHGGAAITQHLISRTHNDDVVIHRIANRALQQLLEKVAVRLGQRLAARSASRWVPLLGAVGAGAYAFYDTSQVAKNAIELFSRPLHLQEPDATSPEGPVSAAPLRIESPVIETAEPAATKRTGRAGSPKRRKSATGKKAKPRRKKTPPSPPPE
jgi:hypothetical protein